MKDEYSAAIEDSPFYDYLKKAPKKLDIYGELTSNQETPRFVPLASKANGAVSFMVDPEHGYGSEEEAWRQVKKQLKLPYWQDAERITLFVFLGNAVVAHKTILRARSNPTVAYHGTPHTVDKFKMAKIGTGEGAQVKGHGLYFTKSKDIADWYRRVISRAGTFYVNGEKLPQYIVGPFSADMSNSLLGIVQLLSTTPNSKMLQFHKEELKRLHDRANTVHAGYHQDKEAANEIWDFYKKHFTKKDIEITEVPKDIGNIYRVLIPDDEELIDYDKPLSKQPLEIKPIIRKLLLLWIRYTESNNIDRNTALRYDDGWIWHDTYGYYDEDKIFKNKTAAIKSLMSNMTGEDLYDMLEIMFKTPAKTSYVLNNEGIKGIKYLSGEAKRGGKLTFNYVIWNEDAISTPRPIPINKR